MTEQEAKAKWCPMARVVAARHSGDVTVIEGHTSGNRLHVRCGMFRRTLPRKVFFLFT